MFNYKLYTTMTNTNVNATLDDIVFEHRNKDYGAYELRTTYAKTLNRAFAIGTSIVLVSISASAIYSSYQHDKEIKREVIVDLERIYEPRELPPVEPPKPEEPEPEPPKQKMVDYVATFVTAEEPEIEYEIPDDSKIDISVIGDTNVEIGNDATSIVSETPPEPDKGLGKIIEVPVIEEPVTFVEQMPSFAGGVSEMYKFLGKNINYPSQAQRANVEGKVFLSFIVEKDGSITNVSTLKGINFGCDEEAERVIKLMPKWISGKQNGRAVRVKFTIPVVFKLSE